MPFAARENVFVDRRQTARRKHATRSADIRSRVSRMKDNEITQTAYRLLDTRARSLMSPPEADSRASNPLFKTSFISDALCAPNCEFISTG